MAAGPCNTAGSVPAQAARNPHGLAVLFPEGRGRSGRVRYTHYTYRQLHEELSAFQGKINEAEYWSWIRRLTELKKTQTGIVNDCIVAGNSAFSGPDVAGT